jgi:glycosyltransferase involved in cell wall biosynthesis
MIKVLHLITDLDTGGAERALCNLVTTHLAEEVEQVVVSLVKGGSFRPTLENAGITVYDLGLEYGHYHLSALMKLSQIIRRVRPDLLHCWMYHANLLGLLCARLLNPLPCIWGIRQSLYRTQLEKLVTRIVIRLSSWLSNFSDGILFNSGVSMRQHRDYGYSSDQMLVIPNGIDTDKFQLLPDSKQEFLSKYQLETNCVLIGIVARYHILKDHRSFLEAAKRVIKATDKLLRFVLVGNQMDGENRELVGMIRELDMEKYVIFLGECSDLPSIYSALDLLVSSSISEAFPNVIGEAMSCETVCIATDVGDCNRLVPSDRLVEPSNPTELSDVILRCINDETFDFRAVGRDARKVIQEGFSSSLITRQYFELYQELLEKKCAE